MTVLFFDIDEETAITRLLGRKIDPVTKEVFGPGIETNPKTGNTLITRDDDTPEAIRNRIEWSKRDTLPLLDGWRARGWDVHTVDASRTPDEVFDTVRAVLDPILMRDD